MVKPRAWAFLLGLPLAGLVLGIVLLAIGSVGAGLVFIVFGPLVAAVNYRRLRAMSRRPPDKI
jgi:hypothetical protein